MQKLKFQISPTKLGNWKTLRGIDCLTANFMSAVRYFPAYSFSWFWILLDHFEIIDLKGLDTTWKIKFKIDAKFQAPWIPIRNCLTKKRVNRRSEGHGYQRVHLQNSHFPSNSPESSQYPFQRNVILCRRSGSRNWKCPITRLQTTGKVAEGSSVFEGDWIPRKFFGVRLLFLVFPVIYWILLQSLSQSEKEMQNVLKSVSKISLEQIWITEFTWQEELVLIAMSGHTWDLVVGCVASTCITQSYNLKFHSDDLADNQISNFKPPNFQQKICFTGQVCMAQGVVFSLFCLFRFSFHFYSPMTLYYVLALRIILENCQSPFVKFKIWEKVTMRFWRLSKTLIPRNQGITFEFGINLNVNRRIPDAIESIQTDSKICNQ